VVRLPVPGALRRRSALLAPRSRAGVLLAVVAGWAILYVASTPARDRRGPPAVAQGRSAAVQPEPIGGAEGRAGHEASGPAPAVVRPELFRELSLPRDAGPASVGRWRLAAGALFLMLVLAVSALVLLRAGVRLRRPAAGAAGPAAEPRRGLARWLAPAVARRPLRVIQSSRLTGRASVHLLEWGGKELLVGCTEQGVTLLGERPAPERAPCAATGCGGPGGAPGGDVAPRAVGGGAP
jgi:hypothetical protein